MKKIVILLLISNVIGLYGAPTPTQAKTIQQNIGAQKFSTLSPNQIKRISDIVSKLSPAQQKRFYASFNHHFNAINESRNRDIVEVHLSKIQYHKPLTMRPEDIDHVIKIARKHATK